MDKAYRIIKTRNTENRRLLGAPGESIMSMRTGSPFIAYGKRYMKTFFRKFWEFLWQQIVIGVILAALIIWQQIRRNIITGPTIRADILAVLEPYLYLLGALILWHLGRTAYLLHLEDSAESWPELRARKKQLEEELEALELPSPPSGMKDMPAALGAALRMKLMTVGDEYEAKKKGRKIERIKSEIKNIADTMNLYYKNNP